MIHRSLNPRFMAGIPVLFWVASPWAMLANIDYSVAVPHSSHISMMLTDFRYNQTAAEYDWSASHYDRVMSGSIAEYRKRNPAIQYYVYALNLTVILESSSNPPDVVNVYYKDMQTWYASHAAYKIEDAFLHDATICPSTQAKTLACRIQINLSAQLRWVINPGDPGLRAYDADRLQRAQTNVKGSGYNADGIFLDEHDSSVLSYWKSFSLREYPVWSKYEDDVVALLAAERKGTGRIIQLNTAESMTSLDQRMAVAAGSVHMEMLNNPLGDRMETSWSFIDTLLKSGVLAEMVNAYTWSEASSIPTLSAGNQPSPQLRFKTAELCSYYMAAPSYFVAPSSSSNLSIFMANNGWNTPFSQQWLKAVEVDIGHPLSVRSLAYQGTAVNGKPVHVWSREYEKALVFMRPKVSWNDSDYSDASKISLNLPAGEKWYPLLSDGTLGNPATSVTLRNPEGLILIKGSAIFSSTSDLESRRDFSGRRSQLTVPRQDRFAGLDVRTVNGRSVLRSGRTGEAQFAQIVSPSYVETRAAK